MHDINFRLIEKKKEAAWYRETFILWPAQWKAFRRDWGASRFQWQPFRLLASQAKRVPDKAGVYSFLVQPTIAAHPHCSFLVYVGKASRQTLRERFQQYLTSEQGPKGRAHIIQMIAKYRRNLLFCCSETPAGMTVSQAEDALIEAYLPPYCRSFPASVGRIVRGLR